MKRACSYCHRLISQDFDKIALPNCDHVYHSKCFLEHCEREVFSKYFAEKDANFEDQSIGFTCYACSSEISLNYIMHACSWQKLIEKLLDRLKADHDLTPEQQAKHTVEIKLTCCKLKCNKFEMRNEIYNDFKSYKSKN